MLSWREMANCYLVSSVGEIIWLRLTRPGCLATDAELYPLVYLSAATFYLMMYGKLEKQTANKMTVSDVVIITFTIIPDAECHGEVKSSTQLSSNVRIQFILNETFYISSNMNDIDKANVLNCVGTHTHIPKPLNFLFMAFFFHISNNYKDVS